jgi:hypothetical protein
MKKDSCKKCKSTRFTFKEVVNKSKTKYYKTCDACGKVVRLHPENNAYHFFLEYCKMEAHLKYKDSEHENYLKNVVEEEKRLKKEFHYLRDNFESLFIFIIRNNSEKDKKLKVTFKDLAEILIKYKNPLTDKDCMSIINDVATNEKAKSLIETN